MPNLQESIKTYYRSILNSEGRRAAETSLLGELALIESDMQRGRLTKDEGDRIMKAYRDAAKELGLNDHTQATHSL
jgi:hypothetical protein